MAEVPAHLGQDERGGHEDEDRHRGGEEQAQHGFPRLNGQMGARVILRVRKATATAPTPACRPIAGEISIVKAGFTPKTLLGFGGVSERVLRIVGVEDAIVPDAARPRFGPQAPQDLPEASPLAEGLVEDPRFPGLPQGHDRLEVQEIRDDSGHRADPPAADHVLQRPDAHQELGARQGPFRLRRRGVVRGPFFDEAGDPEDQQPERARDRPRIDDRDRLSGPLRRPCGRPPGPSNKCRSASATGGSR